MLVWLSMLGRITEPITLNQDDTELFVRLTVLHVPRRSRRCKETGVRAVCIE